MAQTWNDRKNRFFNFKFLSLDQLLNGFILVSLVYGQEKAKEEDNALAFVHSWTVFIYIYI